MKDNTDLRVKRTYKLLSESLKKLMKQKPFDKITVTDVCDEAMVHRTTFYSHFADKFELLQYCMNELESPFDEMLVEEECDDGYKKYYLGVAQKILKHVEENGDFYSVLIKKNKEESLLNSMQRELSGKIEEKLNQCEIKGIELPAPAPILANLYAGGGMSVVLWWLENGMPYSPDKLAEYLSNICLLYTSRCV